MYTNEKTELKKVIRLDKREYIGPKYNNLFTINNELARAKESLALDYIPLRRAYRQQIIVKCNQNKSIVAKVSHKDIKRMEKSRKCEVPINIVDILEVIVDEIKNHKQKFNYRANDQYIISMHMLYNTIDSLNNFMVWINAHDEGVRSQCDKYRTEAYYVQKRLSEFDAKNPELLGMSRKVCKFFGLD